MTAQIVKGTTWHKRLGAIENRFRYRVDYVLIDPEQTRGFPSLFSRNRGNVMALHDRDHGGPRDAGRGATWFRDVLAGEGADGAKGWRILLLAQPRILGTRFTPVSFWFAVDAAGHLRAAVAEVNNTYGDRHAYLCAHQDFAPIGPNDVLGAQKMFHVSPFQPVEGKYAFTFRLSERALSVRIDFRTAEGGLDAGIAGPLQPLTSSAILGVMFSRPLGAVRVLALIHWQALRLWWLGATFRQRPLPPAEEISR